MQVRPTYLQNFLICLVLLGALSSCVKDVDFDQADEFTLAPVVESSLFFFDLTPDRFVDDVGAETQVATDTIDLDVFNDSFLNDNLIRAEFTFEVTNTIARSFTADVSFLDDADQAQVAPILVNVPASNNGEEMVVTTIRDFQEAELEALKQSTQMAADVSIQTGTPITQNSPGNLKLKSKVILYLNIE